MHAGIPTDRPDELRLAVTAYADARRGRFTPYVAIIRERQGRVDLPVRDDRADAAAGERLRALMHAHASEAERGVAAILSTRLHLVDLVNRYARACRVGVADADRVAAELKHQLAQLDAHEREALAALGARLP